MSTAGERRARLNHGVNCIESAFNELEAKFRALEVDSDVRIKQLEAEIQAKDNLIEELQKQLAESGGDTINHLASKAYDYLLAEAIPSARGYNLKDLADSVTSDLRKQKKRVEYLEAELENWKGTAIRRGNELEREKIINGELDAIFEFTKEIDTGVVKDGTNLDVLKGEFKNLKKELARQEFRVGEEVRKNLDLREQLKDERAKLNGDLEKQKNDNLKLRLREEDYMKQLYELRHKKYNEHFKTCGVTTEIMSFPTIIPDLGPMVMHADARTQQIDEFVIEQKLNREVRFTGFFNGRKVLEIKR